MGASVGLGLATGRKRELLAEQATAALGSLRGMAAKVGQMASTMEGMLPDTMDLTVRGALAKLRDHTDTSPWPAIAEVLEEELGQPPERLFSEIDQQPFASASVGQVHRARLFDGREVAVKIQHPGIERAMGADLSNASVLTRLMDGVVPRGFETGATFREVTERFREELDYRREAEHGTRFAERFKSWPEVAIPGVISSHSTRRVLTTEYATGQTLEEMCEGAGEEERAAFAGTLWRFVFGSILIHGEFNADPHPGNYLFGTAPHITFLDFGCVERLAPARHRALVAVHRAAVKRDEDALREALVALFDTRGGALEEFVIGFGRRVLAPVFDAPFRITESYLKALFGYALSHKLPLLRDRAHARPYPAELALLNRLQFGLYSVLARLDVTVDYRALEEPLLAEGMA